VHTDVIQVQDLIIANLGVLRVGGDDEFMTSGYRNLYEISKPRQSAWTVYSKGRE
jgi:hypothetical protein